MRIKSRLKFYMGSGLNTVQGWMAPMLAPVIARMARNGVGTNACLARGALPMPVHYYSPVPDLEDLEKRRVWDKRSDLAGIDFRPEAQEALLMQLGREFSSECNWPLAPTSDPYQFHLEVNNLSYGCASIAHCMMRRHKPHRVIEIGSGNSTLVIAAALRKNAAEPGGHAAEYVAVDPYPRPTIERGLPGLTRLYKQRVELLAPDFFAQLGEDDILFIDSAHVVRMGGDVNFLILDVLPRLAPGVIIHLHDIDLPREYPKVYATNPAFRVFWTEAYLLQAFLACNDDFEILLAMSYLMRDQHEIFTTAFPSYDPEIHPYISSSFWIRRKVGRP